MEERKQKKSGLSKKRVTPGATGYTVVDEHQAPLGFSWAVGLQEEVVR